MQYAEVAENTDLPMGQGLASVTANDAFEGGRRAKLNSTL